ncbi:hypothetical protein L7F22_043515 [Adiantum nelumboides]|nr:hypothetical protein [Adiantum nelumboides]
MSTTEATRRTSSRIANRAAPPSSSSKITGSSEGTKTSNSKKRVGPASTATTKANADKEESAITKKVKPESKSATTSKGGVLSVGDVLPNISLKDEAGSEWTKLGFQVFGLSNDSSTSLKNWKDKKGFQYHLLSDPKGN